MDKCLGDDAQTEGGLAGGLGPVDLDDAAARQAATAKTHVDGERTGGDGLDGHLAWVLMEPSPGRLLVKALTERNNDKGQLGIDSQSRMASLLTPWQLPARATRRNLSDWQEIYRTDLSTGTTWQGTGIVGEKNEVTETIAIRDSATGARLFWRIAVDTVP